SRCEDCGRCGHHRTPSVLGHVGALIEVDARIILARPEDVPGWDYEQASNVGWAVEIGWVAHALNARAIAFKERARRVIVDILAVHGCHREQHLSARP